MEEKLVCYCFGYSEEDMIREVRGEKALSSIPDVRRVVDRANVKAI